VKRKEKDSNMKSSLSPIAAALIALSLSLVPVGAWAEDASVKGEVRKVDAAAGKITLKHGPIKNLDMQDETMTMVFRVKDPAMLRQVKAGDKVLFEADRVDGQITLTKLQKAK
jgi:Cu(I)/Ag(I) efflux system protein CusF